MFINSPDAVKGNRVEKCDMSKAAFQAEENGCIDMTGSEDEILAGMRELITMLPLNNESDVYTEECEDDLNRACDALVNCKGDTAIALSQISDNGLFYEIKEKYVPYVVEPSVGVDRMFLALLNDSYDEEVINVALIGKPNVGKSSLISVVSQAKPIVGDYHFTTIIPVLGVVSMGPEKSFVMADIPGIIEGASEGLGLGHDFLRHIERTRIIIHVVDVSGSEGRNPIEDFEKIKPYMKDFRRNDFKTDIHMSGRPQGWRFTRENVPIIEEILGIEDTLEKHEAKIKENMADPLKKSNMQDKAFDGLRLGFTKAGTRPKMDLSRLAIHSAKIYDPDDDWKNNSED